jgi:uridine kinase
VSKAFTIGITGGSGSGKTFFLNGLASRFSEKEICFISQDNYYKPREEQVLDKNKIYNVDLPTSIDRKQFYADLLTLKSGSNVSKLEYIFNKPGVEPKSLTFRAAPLLVVEGLFIQYFEEIEQELDLRIFIEAKDHVRLGRRIRRDQTERGYDLDDVLYRYEHHVMPVYEQLIEPLKHNADIVIPNNSNFERALKVVTGYLERQLTDIDN